MSKKVEKKPLAMALGTAVAASLSSGMASAEVNPFGMSELSSGYMAVAEAEEGKGGEMKCGASMMKDGEMKCGANMMQKSEEKMGEGSCAGNKPAAAEKKAEDSSGAAESGGE